MFKESFKYYKCKENAPDLKSVLDFTAPNNKDVNEVNLKLPANEKYIPTGVSPPNTWKCYEIRERPGLIFIKNPFTTIGQRYWIVRCLRDYTKSPNKVNLSPKMFNDEHIKDWWTLLHSTNDKRFRVKLKSSMRWSTLGYHHNWDTKVYSEDMKNTFPEDLNKLSCFFAKILGYEKYSAEAAIVNFYPIGTTLSGHTDHSESDLEAPLFSYSFGQTAIFLIGGRTIEEKPTALFLKSGDIVIMSKESRLCYHAVPKVLKSNDEPWDRISPEDTNSVNGDSPPEKKKIKLNEILLKNENIYSMDNTILKNCIDENFWSIYNDYLRDSRININVRRVLKDGQISLSNS